MKKNSSSIRNFVRGTRGANMVEYIILVGVVALIAVLGFQRFSKNISTTVDNQGKSVQNADNTFPKGP
jgi:pilus assembly protein Flp/PilA